jgi:hypothetical protein
VIKIVSITAGQANVDIDGDNDADAADTAILNLSAAERTQLGTLYAAGTSLIRVEIPHFSWWDINWGLAPIDTATRPDQPPPGCT